MGCIRFFTSLLVGSVILATGTYADTPSSDRVKMFNLYLGSAGLVRGGTVAPHWLADGCRFWYAIDTADGPEIHLVDPRANTNRPLFDADRLRKVFADCGGPKLPARGLPIREVEFLDADANVRFTIADKPWLLTLADYKLAEAPPAAKKADAPRPVRPGIIVGEAMTYEQPSPDGKKFATEKDNNLGIRKADSDEVALLTTDGRPDFGWKIAEQMWSPDGTKLAAFKADTRKIPRYPIVHWLRPSLDTDHIPMTKPGGDNTLSELFLVDVATKKATRVETGLADQYVSLVRWWADGTELLIVRTDRTFKKSELCAVDSATGAVRVLVVEIQPTFVQVPMLDTYRVPFLSGEREFLWLSERSGWNHIYLYDRRGKLIRPLTHGEFPVIRVVDVDESSGWVYFTAHSDRAKPYDTHLCRVNLKGEGFAQLTETAGQHDFPAYLKALGANAPAGVRLSPSKEFILDTHSSLDRAPRTELRQADGKFLRVLEEADANGLKNLSWKPPEPFVAKADDGRTDLFGVLYKPADFDPKKKYPVLDYIYNGPQTTWVPRTFNGPIGFLPQAMAQLGYVVIIVDGRGTPERGKAFQDVVYGRFGQNEVPDHVAVLRQLAADRPYIDKERAGVFGGSFGGYMTVRAMLTAPDVYKVGVAFAPVYEMADLPSFMEIYMGTPKGNPKGYEDASCLRLASKLQGKLLIIHGTSDVNAPFAATIKMIAAFINAGRHVDLQILPEQTHAPEGKSALYTIEATRRYFVEYLRP